MAKKPYLVLTIFFTVVVICSLAIWFSPLHFGGDTLVYVALFASAFSAVALYNCWDIYYLETQGEKDLRAYMAVSGYHEIKNPNVWPRFYFDKLSGTEETEFNIVIPLNTIVKFRTPLANILPMNRRFISFRYRCYDLIYDYYKDDFLLFSQE